VRSAAGLAAGRFHEEWSRALIAGVAAHSTMPLERAMTAGVGLALMFLGHLVGWPMARSGSRSITDALAADLAQLGGGVETGVRVRSLEDLPTADAVLLDLTPGQVLAVAGARLPGRYRQALSRWRYGPGVCKVDWALAGPIPWKAPGCDGAGTVHLGGTLDEVARSEAAVWAGEHPERPFVILAQPSLFDPTRAPAGKHTAWAYCHVPNGSDLDISERIEAQVERFAPGFRDLVLARSVRTTGDLEDQNANFVGGDISGGVQSLRQTLARPVPRWSPYATPLPGLYLCSSSTPPGPGVHGMCGYHAARRVLRDLGVLS
jgi:phytoene dehydrogenase-like protein